MLVYQKLCPLVVVQLQMHLVAVQRWTHLVAAVQRQVHLVAAVAGMGSSCGCSCEVDGLRSAVLTSEVHFLLGAFFPGSYFLPLTVRWSFFSATAKSLATCNCGYLVLKSFFLIKKCAAAAKHLMGSLESSLANFGWKGHGSIKLQQFSSAIS